MRKLTILTILVMTALLAVITTDAMAYNMRVEKVSLYKSAVQKPNTIGIKFDLSWDGSFSSVDKNNNPFFDRAWVFVKYCDESEATPIWRHATLIKGGAIDEYNATTGVGISLDKKGAFCKPGTNQIVYWNIEGVTSAHNFKIKVFAIEMVYVPTGAFYVGSGAPASDAGTFYTYPSTATPYQITDEAYEIAVGVKPGNLYYSLEVGSRGDGLGPIPSTFPKGFQGFYMMKYELTQGQYKDFLNTLTRNQQTGRVASMTAGNYALAGTPTAANTNSALNYRNGIRVPLDASTTVPITFRCDYIPFAEDGVYDGVADGQDIACNYVSWADLTAYADWAGLRPMTEFEFEKACRGPIYPVGGEYAWGTTAVSNGVYTISEWGKAAEGIATGYSTAAGNMSWGTTNESKGPPLRVGIFAANANNTGRMTSGASYYGIMELSGNVYERPVTVGYSASREQFIGSHGDGSLDSNGLNDNADWPGANAYGAGLRGGSDYGSPTHVSNRSYAAKPESGRAASFGIRCVRTASS